MYSGVMKSAIRTKKLDATKRTDAVACFASDMNKRIIGQPEAVDLLVNTYQIVKSGLQPHGRPYAVLLFAGPTGSGKTRAVEAAAEVLLGSPNAVVKIDCAEYQHGHEIAKLVGSPPGYLGHRETVPLLSQKRLNEFNTSDLKLSFLLFDEVEKAHDSLYALMLGILDKGTCTLGDNSTTDFSRTVVVMTTNLGARSMDDIAEGRNIGYQRPKSVGTALQDVALIEIKKRFTPEFMNRVDNVVVFNRLTNENYRDILHLELGNIQSRILNAKDVPLFTLCCTRDAETRLLELGVNQKYGARSLKRILEAHVVLPLSNLVSTGQIDSGSAVIIDYNNDSQPLTFESEIRG